MKQAGLALAALLAVSAAAAAETSLTYDEAKALADANEAAISAALSDKLHQAQANALHAAVAACQQRPGADFSAFTIVMELDAEGRIVRNWLLGDTPLATCVHAVVVEHGLAGTWTAPFYTSIEMSFPDWEAKRGSAPHDGDGDALQLRDW